MTTQQQIALAERYFRSGQSSLSEKMLHEVISRTPGVSKAYELLGYIFGNRGEMKRCEEFLVEAVRLPDCSPEAFFYLGRVQLSSGRAAEAITAFDRSIGLAGEYFESLHELGVAYTMLSQHEAALDAFQRAERIRIRLTSYRI
jgi:protein O-GlcNAc transferase